MTNSIFSKSSLSTFDVELAWIDGEIANLMSDLKHNKAPNYSKGLLDLADAILQKNPEAIKNLL